MRALFMRVILVFLFFHIINSGLIFPQSEGEEHQINTFTLGNQLNPTIDADKTADFIISWESDRQDNNFPGIYARRYYKTGLPKGEEFQVNTSWAPHYRPAIAVGNLGNFVIAWENYWIENPTSSGISARVFDQDGNALGQEFQVNEYISDFQGEPDVAIDSTGNFVITWQSWGMDGDRSGISARMFDKNSIPLGPEFQVNSYTADNQLHPEITMDQQGSFAITWSSFGQDGDKTGIFAKRFDREGNTAGPEFIVNSSSKGWQEWPAIAIDTWGNLIICWHSWQEDDQAYDISARIFDKIGTAKGLEFQVNSISEDWQVFPSIAVDSEGSFIITWQSRGQDGDSFGIYARIFEKNGQSLGPEFQVNSTATGSQESVDIYMFSRKTYGFAWQSQQNEETEWDLFSKTFAIQLPGLESNPKKFKEKHDPQKNMHSPRLDIYRDSGPSR